jgi:hypothetical protein
MELFSPRGIVKEEINHHLNEGPGNKKPAV